MALSTHCSISLSLETCMKHTFSIPPSVRTNPRGIQGLQVSQSSRGGDIDISICGRRRASALSGPPCIHAHADLAYMIKDPISRATSRRAGTTSCMIAGTPQSPTRRAARDSAARWRARGVIFSLVWRHTGDRTAHTGAATRSSRHWVRLSRSIFRKWRLCAA